MGTPGPCDRVKVLRCWCGDYVRMEFPGSEKTCGVTPWARGRCIRPESEADSQFQFLSDSGPIVLVTHLLCCPWYLFTFITFTSVTMSSVSWGLWVSAWAWETDWTFPSLFPHLQELTLGLYILSGTVGTGNNWGGVRTESDNAYRMLKILMSVAIVLNDSQRTLIR